MDHHAPPFPLSGKTVLASFLLTLLDACLKADPSLDAGDLLIDAGIDPAILNSPDMRVPLELGDRLWQIAHDASGDPALGLHVGEQVRPGSFNVVGQLLMTCASLADSIDLAIRYSDFIGQGALLDQRIDAKGVAIIWQPINPDWPMRDQRIDASMAATLTFARWISGQHLYPAALSLTRREPADISEYKRIFNCPIRYNADENAMVMRRQDLALPPREANEALHSFLSDHVASLQSERAEIDLILYRLRQVLQTSLLQGEEPVIDIIAPKLQMSPRSLQRRLQDLGVTFRQELACIREDMACYWLQSSDMSLQAISDGLGFAELPIFSRAFKSWTGESPAQWRKTHRKVT